MNKKQIYFSLLSLLCMTILAVSAFNVGVLTTQGSLISDTSTETGIDYTGIVCTQVIRADGTAEPTVCQHNTLYNTGAEAIEDYLADGTGAGDAFDWIELCDSLNSTCDTPVAIEETAVFDSLNYTNWTGCGMDEVAGTVGDVGNGNWTIFNTFTSTCDGVTTNVTRLRNSEH